MSLDGGGESLRESLGMCGKKRLRLGYAAAWNSAVVANHLMGRSFVMIGRGCDQADQATPCIHASQLQCDTDDTGP